MWVKVKRAYLYQGKRVEPDTTVEVNDAFGRELILSDKVERVEPEAAPSGPMTTESNPALVVGAGSGGESNKSPEVGKPEGKPAAGKEKSNAGK